MQNRSYLKLKLLTVLQYRRYTQISVFLKTVENPYIISELFLNMLTNGVTSYGGIIFFK